MSQCKITKSLKLTKRVSLKDEKNYENLNYSYVSLTQNTGKSSATLQNNH